MCRKRVRVSYRPAKAVQELNRLLLEKGELEIRYSENQASFTLKDDKGLSVLVITKLIEGTIQTTASVPNEVKRARVPDSGGISACAASGGNPMTIEKINLGEAGVRKI